MLGATMPSTATTPRLWTEMTWPEVHALDLASTIALLPVGATEAHGPHLPLSTDVVIGEAMARAGGERLVEAGWEAVVLPPLAYTAAPFAAGFAGTISVSPETVTALLVDIVASLAQLGAKALVICNAHLDPTHVGSIHAALERCEATPALTGLKVVFPDITRKPWALRLSDEFKSGACHAGCYEGSIVMAERPDLVRQEVQRELVANPVSLARAIRDGKISFEEAGGDRAYFGDPAAATMGEGQQTVHLLGGIVADAVVAALGEAGAGGLGAK